jgi:hypothetical protein
MKVKVFRLELDDGLNDKVLLSTKHPIREDSLQLRDRTFFYLKESLQALEHGLQRAKNTGPESIRAFWRAR